MTELCCCEYYNAKGVRSHILATCCDCEALDDTCDRCIRCGGVSVDQYNRLCDTIQDRCRVPGFTGRGAIRLDSEVAGPLVSVAAALLLATVHPILTVLAFIILATGLFHHLRMWSKQQPKPRTKTFYMFGLGSTWIMLVTYFIAVMDNIQVPYTAVLLTLFCAMMYALYNAKKDPGLLNGRLEQETPLQESEGDQKVDKLRSSFQEGGVNQMAELHCQTQSPMESQASIPLTQATDERLLLFCEDCKQGRRSRTGHCPVCRVCVDTRDHHCVWIDNCIGAKNHRSFMAAVTLYILTGIYGSCLAFYSICEPQTIFIIPLSCNNVYLNFWSTWVFVSACFTLLCCGAMSLVLVHQTLLISQNLTSQELHLAAQANRVKWGVYAIINPNNRGFCKNWSAFLLGRRTADHLDMRIRLLQV